MQTAVVKVHLVPLNHSELGIHVTFPYIRFILLRAPADIRTAVDEFFEPSADEGGKQSQVMYECLSLLCGGGVVGGGKFAESDSFVERLSVRLEQDRAQQKRVRTVYKSEVAAKLFISVSHVLVCIDQAPRYCSECGSPRCCGFDGLSLLRAACVVCLPYLLLFREDNDAGRS